MKKYKITLVRFLREYMDCDLKIKPPLSHADRGDRLVLWIKASILDTLVVYIVHFL